MNMNFRNSNLSSRNSNAHFRNSNVYFTNSLRMLLSAVMLASSFCGGPGFAKGSSASDGDEGRDKGLYREKIIDKGLYREKDQAPEVEPKLTLTKDEAEARLLENSQKSLALSEKFAALVQKHLELAGKYDVEAFRKTDDELRALFEEMDANYLESRMLYKHLGMPEDELAADKKAIQDSKMFMYKSSAIFNLCFGRPLNSAQYGRLALSLNEHLDAKQEFQPDVMHYLGSALCWAGDYTNAEKQLREAITIGKNRPYTQLKAGAPVNVAGRNPFTEQQLATVLIAENQGSKAIELLNTTAATAPSPEVKGSAEALLAVAYAVDRARSQSSKPNASGTTSNTARSVKPNASGSTGNTASSVVPNASGATSNTASSVKQHAVIARTALQGGKDFTFPALAKETLGIVEAVDGNYALADKLLSEAIPKLQDSPIKLGHRLEAAQASLWRAYCREQLGNKAGSEQDRNYAMSFADESPHLVNVSKMLDTIFGKTLTKEVSSKPTREKWAIIVGVGDFADEKIPKLKYSKKDAEDVSKFLVEHAGFKPDHIRTLVDGAATKEQLLNSIAGDWLPSVSKPDDVVFLFVSSHGTPAYQDIGAMNSVVTYDTKMDKLFSTSIPMPSIVRLLSSKLNKRHTFVVLDTCYAGGLGAPTSNAHELTNVEPDLLLSSNYQLLVSSSDGHERSWESKRYPNSVFTRQMIDTLEANREYEKFESVFDSIQKRVSEEVAADHKGITQTPNFTGLWSGKELTRKTH